MRILSKLSVGLACLGVLVATGDALAKHRYGRRPVVVERRSFLDPGTQVPVGSTNQYMVQQTYYHHADSPLDHQRSWYMGETLPRRGDQDWDPGFQIELLP